MNELRVNLWTAPAEAVCITTNGVVKRDGNLVMGRGCAKEAALKWPTLPKELGKLVAEHGNHVYDFDLKSPNVKLYSFPTKNHYSDKSDLLLIERSLIELTAQVSLDHLQSVALPRPGCGNGGLDWEKEVKPLCEQYLDDRFIIVDFPDHFISRDR